MQAIKTSKCVWISEQLQSGVVFKTKRMMKVVLQLLIVCRVCSHRRTGDNVGKLEIKQQDQRPFRAKYLSDLVK